jgi:hypothetical protein
LATRPRTAAQRNFDALGRVRQHTDAAKAITTLGYPGARDDLNEVRDARSLRSAYGLDGFGRPLAIDSPSPNSPAPLTLAWAYDPQQPRSHKLIW